VLSNIYYSDTMAERGGLQPATTTWQWRSRFYVVTTFHITWWYSGSKKAVEVQQAWRCCMHRGGGVTDGGVAARGGLW